MKFAFLVYKNKTQLALLQLKITPVAVMMLLIMLFILSMWALKELLLISDIPRPS